MLRACYPAQVGSGSFLWADRNISTTQVEFDLAQREAEAVSKLYARLNTHVSDEATSDTAGSPGSSDHSVATFGSIGEPWQETIRASPSGYQSSYQAETATLDTAVLSQQLQALRIRAMASSYLAPQRGWGSVQQHGFGLSRHEGFPVQNNLPAYHQQRGSVPLYAKNTVKSSSKRQRSLGDKVKRTIYICDIDQQVTEEQLATVFQECGRVIDCRVCGDPNSAMKFAFIEFLEEAAVKMALTRNGIVLGMYPLRVLPSKTAIVPVNNQYLPRTEVERELCGRTVYAANIDKKVDRTDVQAFFETLCGPVSKIRLLGDYHHPTRIAFVEFTNAESARAALNCSGAMLGSTPVRVSPSKTPVRPDPRHDDTPVPRHSSA